MQCIYSHKCSVPPSGVSQWLCRLCLRTTNKTQTHTPSHKQGRIIFALKRLFRCTQTHTRTQHQRSILCILKCMCAHIPTHLRRSLVGGLAGATSTGILHPLHTIRNIRQASPYKFINNLKVAEFVYGAHGLKGFYFGALPAMALSAPSSALYFGCPSCVYVHTCMYVFM